MKHLFKIFSVISILAFSIASCQKPEEATALNVKSSAFSFNEEGGEKTLTFVANKNWKISVEDSWCHVSSTSGSLTESEAVSLTVTCDRNSTYGDRECTITIMCAELSEFISVTQSANLAIILSTTEEVVSQSGGTFDIEAQFNEGGKIQVTSSDWIKLNATKALSTMTYTFSVLPNTSKDERIGQILFTDTKNNIAQEIKVIQKQQNAVDMDADSYDVDPDGETVKVSLHHNIPFVVESKASWLSVIETKAYTEATVLVSAEPNYTDSDREGIVTISSNDGSISHDISFCQKKKIWPVTDIVIDKTSADLKVGDRFTLNASVKPDNATDKSITWSSSNVNVATVDDRGEVTARQIGSCDIIASAGGKTASCKVAVTRYSSAVDLSSNGTANSYVIPSGGVYKFKAVKGNGNAPIDGSKAVILWRTYNDSRTPSTHDIVVGPVIEDGYVYFATSNTYQEGNAVIAVTDDGGKVQWSWHLWVTSADLEGLKQTYANNAGILMDRNLGALSATAGDPLTFGLLYQWGRKDPFVGCASYSNTTTASTDITWPSPVMTSLASDGQSNAISYSIEHPTTYIYNSYGCYEWQAMSKEYCDTGLWSPKKTIYDPCPPGWRVPDGGDDGVWVKAGIPNASTYSGTLKGITIDQPYCDNKAWYPSIGGGRQWNGGCIMHVGEWGNYWSCTYFYESWMAESPQFYNAYYSFVFYPGETRAKDHSYSGQGQAVRCCRE